MNGDIRKFIQCCEKCQRTNPPFKKSNAALHPVPVHSQVWHTVSGNIMIIHSGNKTDYEQSYRWTCPIIKKGVGGH